MDRLRSALEAAGVEFTNGDRPRGSPRQDRALRGGYATDLWTLSRVGKLIEKISGQRYSESGVWRLLKGLNFSCQRPSGRAIKRDEQAIRHWKTKR